MHSAIQFNQNAWLKPYIDMNTELRKEAKNDFEKDFFKLMNSSVFWNIMENVRKHRDTNLVTTDKRRNQLASEPKILFIIRQNTFQKNWCQSKWKNKSKNE